MPKGTRREANRDPLIQHGDVAGQTVTAGQSLAVRQPRPPATDHTTASLHSLHCVPAATVNLHTHGQPPLMLRLVHGQRNCPTYPPPHPPPGQKTKDKKWPQKRMGPPVDGPIYAENCYRKLVLERGTVSRETAPLHCTAHNSLSLSLSLTHTHTHTHTLQTKGH